MACTMCGQGWYTRLSAQTECLPCIVGTFATAIGGTSCTKCAAGVTTHDEGSVACEEKVGAWGSPGTGAAAPAPPMTIGGAVYKLKSDDA
jgi:hypothetical protein